MRLAVCVSSTTGEGDPPDNALKFMRFLKQKDHAATLLSHWQYTVLGSISIKLLRHNMYALGLGDTNYENFCNGGKQLHAKLDKCAHAAYFDDV